MNDEQFDSLIEQFQKYLEKEKVFIMNPFRMRDVNRALEIAQNLFPDAKKEIEDDPLQLGALILSIESFDFVFRGQTEINLFCELIQLVDNFEFIRIAKGDHEVRFAATLKDALIRIG